MPTYKVVPFVASIGPNESAPHVAAQLERLIQSHADAGWEYLRLESVETLVAGNPGCLGFGATQPVLSSFSMPVFQRP